MRRLRIQLRNLSLLTVGSAYPRFSLADINTVRVGGEVIIPGSSLKGALRTAGHRAARRLGMRSCGEVEPSKVVEAHERMGGKCDVCELFGMPGPGGVASSKLFVSDLRPKDPVATEVITRVSLDPRSGKAWEGGLFTVEVVPICTVFEGELMLLDDKEKYLELLAEALKELMDGTLGKGSLVEIRIPEGEGKLRELSSWRWNLCP